MEQDVKNTIYNRTKETPFAGWNKINRVEQTFSKGGKIRRNGKEINLQDFINENAQDCTIYQVYEKYRGDMKMTQAELNTMHHKVSDELSAIKDLPSAFEVMKKAEQTWRDLPLDIRKEFGHDVKKFQQTGLDWANGKIKAEQDRINKIKAEQAKMEAEAQKQSNTGVTA